MNIDIARKGASLLERIDDLENTIFRLEEFRKAKNFKLIGLDETIKNEVDFEKGKLSTEIFSQNILEYTINNFNIELKELRDELDELK